VPRHPGSIVQALINNVTLAPEHPALLFGGATWTFRRLLDDATSWAQGLQHWGVNPGERVALFLDNTPTFVAAYLGIHLAGGIAVLVNTQYRQVELRHILGDATARLCLTDRLRLPELARVEADLPALEAVVITGDDEAGSGDPDRGVARVRRLTAAELLTPGGRGDIRAPDPEATALLIYTSGTTGPSKGAMLSHRNMAANIAAIAEAWQWTKRDRLLLALPLFHVHGLTVGINGTLLTGGTVDLRSRFDAAEVYATLLRGETTMFFGVPTMYTRLLAEAQSRPERPPPLRLYVSGSAPLSAQTFEEFRERFGQPILERYGMTETLMNLSNPYVGERRPGTVGRPFPGQEARIVDTSTRQPILDESLGEIQVRGPHVFQGYWRRPEATAAAFDAGGWFSTGDLGWRSADGYYTIAGRARELIISGGYNIYPREVEEVLERHPAVAEAGVLGLPDPDYGEQVVAAVVRRAEAVSPGKSVDDLTADLIALCRDQLASYKKPRRLVYVDALPRNALGKVQKHVLREWIESGRLAVNGTSSAP
jgi:malonyl-CoA/methylmalonyl-CoA synthetase